MKQQTEVSPGPERKGVSQSFLALGGAVIGLLGAMVRTTCRGLVSLLSRWT